MAKLVMKHGDGASAGQPALQIGSTSAAQPGLQLGTSSAAQPATLLPLSAMAPICYTFRYRNTEIDEEGEYNVLQLVDWDGGKREINFGSSGWNGHWHFCNANKMLQLWSNCRGKDYSRDRI